MVIFKLLFVNSMITHRPILTLSVIDKVLEDFVGNVFVFLLTLVVLAIVSKSIFETITTHKVNTRPNFLCLSYLFP